MRVLWALPLLLVALAGCFGDDGPPDVDETPPRPAAGVLRCLPRDEVAMPPAGEGPVCNLWTTTAPATRQANELSITVNPLDPLNIVASGKDYTPAEAGECVRDGIYVSFDGGRSWINSNVPGSPWRAAEDPTTLQPDAELSKFWCVTDPVVQFAPDGTLYWTVMPYQCDPLTGSKTGEGVLPSGGFNDWFWSCSSMYVLVSDDGGRTFPVIREVAFGPRLEHDKQWLSVAPDGTVLLCWDRDPSYQLFALVPTDNPAEQLQRPGYMQCATSDDKGRSWTEPTDVNPPADQLGRGGTWDGFLPWVDWDARNNAWMAALDAAGNIIVSHSPDGLTWHEPTIVGSYTNPPPSGAYGWPALQGSAFRTFALPALAIDRSGGPYDGHMYVTWMDHSGSDADIVLTRFNGTDWSAPIRIHDDDPAAGFDQFMPAINVGPDGTVDAIWYDRRDDPDNHLFDLYYAFSLDGGATWSQNLRVSEVSSDEQYSHHQNGMVFLGDYIDLDSGHGAAYPVWVDTRHGKADAFAAVIERPGANPD